MIVILNGASSSGKTSLARALQQCWRGPLLHLGTDTLLGMLPQSYVGMKPSAREGFEFFEDADERGPVVRVRCGPAARKLERSFARAVALLSEDGHDVVLDLVLFDRESVVTYASALHGQRSYLVGVRCDLAVAEARELARGDRFLNLARSQAATVHAFREHYDLEVDSTSRGPHELAQTILQLVAEQPSPSGFHRLRAALLP